MIALPNTFFVFWSFLSINCRKEGDEFSLSILLSKIRGGCIEMIQAADPQKTV